MFEHLAYIEPAWFYSPKALSSMSFGITCLITAGFIFADLLNQHMMPSRWRRAMFFLALAFTFTSGYGFSRFHDAILDLKFIAANPDTVTTASQDNFFILEGPLFGATFFIFLFLLFLNFAYYHKEKPPK